MERRYLVRQFDSNFFGYLRQSESVDNPEEYNSKKEKFWEMEFLKALCIQSNLKLEKLN